MCMSGLFVKIIRWAVPWGSAAIVAVSQQVVSGGAGVTYVAGWVFALQ